MSRSTRRRQGPCTDRFRRYRRSRHGACRIGRQLDIGRLSVEGDVIERFDARTVSGDIEFDAGFGVGIVHTIETVSGDLSIESKTGVTVEVEEPWICARRIADQDRRRWRGAGPLPNAVGRLPRPRRTRRVETEGSRLRPAPPGAASTNVSSATSVDESKNRYSEAWAGCLPTSTFRADAPICHRWRPRHPCHRWRRCPRPSANRPDPTHGVSRSISSKCCVPSSAAR